MNEKESSSALVTLVFDGYTQEEIEVLYEVIVTILKHHLNTEVCIDV